MAKKGEIELKVKVNDDEAKKKVKSFGENAKQQFLDLGNVVKAVFATAVVGAIKSALDAVIDFGREANKFKGISDSFRSMARSMGQDAEDMLAKMRAGVKGTVSDLDLMTTANEAMMRGLDMTKVDEMMRIAMAASKATGMSVKDTTEMVLNGLAEQKANMLENVGISFDAGKAMAAYAQSLGTTADKLTIAQQKQAFLTEALKVGGSMADIVGQSKFLSFSQVLDKSAASFENLKAKIGQAALPALTSLANVFDRMIDKMKGEGLSSKQMQSGFDAFGKAVAFVGGVVLGTIDDLVKGFKALTQTIIAGGKAAADFAVAAGQTLAGQLDKAKQTMQDANVQLGISAQASRDLSAAVLDLGNMYQKGMNAVDQYNAGLREQQLEEEKTRKAVERRQQQEIGGKFQGYNIQEHLGAGIDRMAGMASGFGSAMIEGGKNLVNQAIQTQQAIGQAELQQMQNRQAQLSWGLDLMSQIQTQQWEAKMEELRAQQAAELEVFQQGQDAKMQALIDSAEAAQEFTDEMLANGEISQAEHDLRSKVAAQKAAQDQRALAQRQAKEKYNLQQKQNADMKKLEDDKNRAEHDAKKQQALITWIMSAAQLEASKRLSTSQIQVQAALGAMAAISQSVAMMGPFGLAVGLPIAAMIRAQAQAQVAAVNSQIAIPPAELFLAEGGIVRGSPKGTLATIGENNRSEAVIPLDGPNAANMGNTVVLQVNNLYATDDVPEMLLDKIDEGLRRRAITGRSVFASQVMS